MIHLDGINKCYGSNVILKDFNLKIDKNEQVGLIGISGSGKTTILNMIAGLVKPDSGNIIIYSNKIGYIFQETRLIPWKNVLNNIIIGAKALKLKRYEAVKKCQAILDRLEIRKYERFYPSQLSGGIAQRVSIARAFFIDPEILLMDEPFSSLDPGLRNRLHNYVLELTKERNITLLYVSHFLNDIIKVTNKVYVLKKEGYLGIISQKKNSYFSENDYSLYEN